MIALSRHAEYRIWLRGFSPDDLCAALAGRCIAKLDGSSLFYDNHTHVTVAVAEDGTAPTVFTMRKSVLKRRYSR